MANRRAALSAGDSSSENFRPHFLLSFFAFRYMCATILSPSFAASRLWCSSCPMRKFTASFTPIRPMMYVQASRLTYGLPSQDGLPICHRGRPGPDMSSAIFAFFCRCPSATSSMVPSISSKKLSSIRSRPRRDAR